MFSRWVGGSVPSGGEVKAINKRTLPDQALIAWYFEKKGRETTAFASTKFLEASKERYGEAPWLVREIAQNFVDHNPIEKGTLNGVSIDLVAQRESHEFRISGGWTYDDPSGLMGLHSDKPDGGPNAGGNGIGLKQVALILMRDYGVSEFEVDGGNWKLNYHIVDAMEVNAELEVWGVNRRLKTNWLSSDLEAKVGTGENSYRIVVDDSTIVESLGDIKQMAVNDENVFLQNPDFENSLGALVWHDQGPVRGRLFINGQVMNYESQRNDDYWGNMEGVSVRLNDLDYEMSVDRPPITSWKLDDYLDKLVRSMSAEDLVGQLKKSQFIWDERESKNKYGLKSGSRVVVDSLVWRLSYTSDYEASTFGEIFGSEFLADDVSFRSSSNAEELRGQGYVLIPSSFSKIGAPLASSMLSENTQALENKPRTNQAQKIAQDFGIVVGHAYQPQSLEEGLRVLKNALGGELIVDEGRYIVSFDRVISPKLLSHPLFETNANASGQTELYTLRSFIFAGMEGGAIQNVSTASSGFITTYSIDHDDVIGKNQLWARNTEAGGSGVLSLTMESQHDIQKLWDGIEKGEAYVPRSPSSDAIVLSEGGSQALSQLEAEVAEKKKVDGGESPFAGEYQRWRADSGSYGLQVDHVDGVGIDQMIAEYNRADIKGVEDKSRNLTEDERRLVRLGMGIKEKGHDVENFKIVDEPTANELEQLKLLTNWVQYGTGYGVSNYLFLFTGDGAKGVNIGQEAIGLHRSLFAVDFDEAASTFTHEIAHNHAMNHGQEFDDAHSALNYRMMAKKRAIANAYRAGEAVTTQDRYLLDAPKRWADLMK